MGDINEISTRFPVIMNYFRRSVVKLWPAPLLPPSLDRRRQTGVINWVAYRQGGQGHAGYLTISILNNRFCFNVMRDHKSNGIYFVVNLQENTFIQKCHDQSCCDFRSPTVDLNTSDLVDL